MSVAIDNNPNTSQIGTTATVNFTGLTMGSVSNPAIVCLITWDSDTVTISSVNWDATGTPQALTAITGASAQGSNNNNAALYGRVGSITSGNKTLRVVFSAACNSYISAISFSGVNQTGGATSFPNGTGNTNGSANTAPSIAVTTTSGDFVVGAESDNDVSHSGISGTQVFENTAGATLNSYGNCSAGSGTSVTLSGTLGSSVFWAYAACDVAATAAATLVMSSRIAMVSA